MRNDEKMTYFYMIYKHHFLVIIQGFIINIFSNLYQNKRIYDISTIATNLFLENSNKF